MSVCRGCGGSGIGAHITPREAQLLMQKIELVKDDRVRYCRVDNVWAGIEGPKMTRGRMAMSGALLYVITEFEKLTGDGWELHAGSIAPTRAALCSWCGGGGEAGILLTPHTMADMLETARKL